MSLPARCLLCHHVSSLPVQHQEAGQLLYKYCPTFTPFLPPILSLVVEIGRLVCLSHAKRNESALFFCFHVQHSNHFLKTYTPPLVSAFTHGACICQATHGTKGSLLCDTKGECYQVQIECKLSAFFMWWCCERVEATTGMSKGFGKKRMVVDVTSCPVANSHCTLIRFKHATDCGCRRACLRHCSDTRQLMGNRGSVAGVYVPSSSVFLPLTPPRACSPY